MMHNKHALLSPLLPDEVDSFSRRQFLKTGSSLVAYASVEKLLNPLIGSSKALAQSRTTYPPKKKLVWVNMSGGWDILEVLDPKRSSTSGIDMIYDYGLSHPISSTQTDARLGRWLPNMAQIGDDMLIIRGLAMGTTSHTAGAIYMDTGVLSNAGRVNSASIPAIVASEGGSTIPMIQLSGGMDPQTDRGLLSPVSVVRANNLELYRQMYPTTSDGIARQISMLDYVKRQTEAYKEEVAPGNMSDDRLDAFSAAEEKIRRQLSDNVGLQLSLTNQEMRQFLDGAPAGTNQSLAQNFALAQKLINGSICDCINLGFGGFDTHSGQSQRLQPILAGVDFIMKRFVDGLRASGQLDQTLIVMYSDFGRTPKMNSASGRDHWPVGGAILIGGGIRGGRAIGATDDNMLALSVNLQTGQLDPNGEQLSPIHLGGTVLALTLGQEYLQFRNYLSSIPALL